MENFLYFYIEKILLYVYNMPINIININLYLYNQIFQKQNFKLHIIYY